MYRFAAFALVIGMASNLFAQTPSDEKSNPKEPLKKLTVAHIELKGSYSEGADGVSLFSEVVETLGDALQRLKKAANDDSLEAVILHIDGPHIGWAKLNELRTAVSKVRQKG